MSEPKKDLFDTIDDYFSQINANEIADKINKSMDSFSKNISDTVHASINKQNKNPQFSRFLKDYSSRFDYVKDALTACDIPRGKGSPVGYQQALDDIQNLADNYRHDLDACAKRVHQLIKEIKLHASQYKKSYVDGYIHGCEYALRIIKRSSGLMMEKIINEIL